jgi:hypothetical protein
MSQLGLGSRDKLYRKKIKINYKVQFTINPILNDEIENKILN